MSLINQIKEKQLEARKAKDTIPTELYTTLLGEAVAIGKNKGNRETTDEEVVALIKKFLNNINISFEYASEVGRNKLARERELLAEFMPTELDIDRLRNIILGMIVSGNNKGQIMKYLKENFNGQYDGKVASTIITEESK